jgi:hypothetical protein
LSSGSRLKRIHRLQGCAFVLQIMRPASVQWSDEKREMFSAIGFASGSSQTDVQDFVFCDSLRHISSALPEESSMRPLSGNTDYLTKDSLHLTV